MSVAVVYIGEVGKAFKREANSFAKLMSTITGGRQKD